MLLAVKVLVAFLCFFVIYRLMSLLRNKRNSSANTSWKKDITTALLQTVVFTLVSYFFT